MMLIMRVNSIFQLVFPAVLAVGLLSSAGCSRNDQRREGLGGGALATVSVTLLTSEVEGSDEAGGAAAAEAKKITSFGTFKGRVTVSGATPTLVPLVSKGQQVPDGTVCAVNPIPDESVIIGSDGGLKNVFVFLSRVPNVDVPPPPSEPVVIGQKGCRFEPHASIIRVDQPLRLTNNDPVAHNVKLSGTAMSFNSTIPGGDTTGVETKYNRPERGPIPMACDFHGWMSAYQLALDHPWAALTDENGNFEITGVPAGEMEFVVWHEAAGNIERKLKVNIPADGVAEKNIEVNASMLKPKSLTK